MATMAAASDTRTSGWLGAGEGDSQQLRDELT